MAFSPFARFRNFTLDNLKALLEVYPDMSEQYSWNEMAEIIESKNSGYKRTAYQQACQFGLEDRSNPDFRVHSYLYTFDDEQLLKYLEFWIKTYYAPNPYVHSDDEAIIIYCELIKEIISKDGFKIDYYDFFNRRIGGKSDDILLNAIKAYCYPIKYINNADEHILYIEQEDVEKAKQEVAFIEKEYPIGDSKSKKEFFDRYNYENYCKFFGISAKTQPIGDTDDRQPKNLQKADNIILYGVPGCGKSHEIKENYCDNNFYMERTVFHPDYTYSDFVGQILPKVVVDNTGEKSITYDFEPGVFTRILKKAKNDPDNNYYLIIEEINRGNAPAIFGDIFQLLDRNTTGESEYGISNESIAENVYGDKSEMIKIPSNLFLLATMNTSDQNVFTLDTAFKRRWSMKHIKNDIRRCEYVDYMICDTGVSWGAFAETINNLIIETATENLSNEDNRLGAYFVRVDELNNPERFGEKVLMYLWNDAFKYDHDKIFKQKYKALDQLIDGFTTDKMGVFREDLVFAISDSDIELLDTFEEMPDQTPAEKYLEKINDSYYIQKYNELWGLIKERIPNAYHTTTPKIKYISWRSDDVVQKKISHSFADIIIQPRTNRILIMTSTPTKEENRVIGREIEQDDHHNFVFEIDYCKDRQEDIDINQLVDVIVDSYEQLSKE